MEIDKFFEFNQKNKKGPVLVNLSQITSVKKITTGYDTTGCDLAMANGEHIEISNEYDMVSEIILK